MIVNRYGNIYSENILIQMVDDHDLSVMDKEVEQIENLTGSKDFCLVTFKVDDWNKALSPWKAPAVFGKEAFDGKASETLEKLLDFIDKDLMRGKDKSNIHIYIGGYSLAGLFALWCAYKTDIFCGVAAASPSVWFPGFIEYIEENEINTSCVYLSLGDKESKTKNAVMAKVGDNILRMRDHLADVVNIKFEWNEGNHFKDAEIRTAKAFAWVIGQKNIV